MNSNGRQRQSSGFLLSQVVVAVLLIWSHAPLAAEPKSAEDWLLRLGPAINETDYLGVFVYTRGDQVSSMRVAHRFRNGQVEERLVQQDGQNGEILRKGTRVYCVLPDHGRIQLDQVIPSGPFTNAFASQQVQVSRWYQPGLLDDDRVAGYATAVVTLTARDGHRYSYRLWLEKNTGLLVKSHVESPDREVLERFQFTSLEITDGLPDSEFEIQSEGTEVKHNLPPVPTSSPVQRMEGWELEWHPEGFMPAATPRSGGGKAVAFSDGLASFSVFVERMEQPMPSGVSRIGATTAYMRRVEVGGTDYLVAVVGEIPPATAMRVAESVSIAGAGNEAMVQEGAGDDH